MADRNMEEFREYMKQGNEFRETVVRYMERGNAHMENTQKYIETCDDERKDYGKRIGSLENTRAAQNAVIAAFMAATTLFVEFFKKG